MKKHKKTKSEVAILAAKTATATAKAIADSRMASAKAIQDYVNNDIHTTLLDHSKHLQIANHEMGDIRTRLAIMETKIVTCIRQNWFLISLILATAIAIIFKK